MPQADPVRQLNRQIRGNRTNDQPNEHSTLGTRHSKGYQPNAMTHFWLTASSMQNFELHLPKSIIYTVNY